MLDHIQMDNAIQKVAPARYLQDVLFGTMQLTSFGLPFRWFAHPL